MSTSPVRLVGSGALISPTRRLLRGVEWPFAVLVVVSMAAALSQALVLAIIVQIAMHLTESNLLDTDAGGILGLLPADPDALILAGFAAILTVFGLELAAARLQAHLGGRVLRRLRTDLYETYAGATVEAQQGLRAGELAQLLTVNGAYGATATLNAAAAVMALTTFVTLSLVAMALSPAPTIIGALAVAVVLFLVRPITARGRTTSTDMARRNTDLTETTTLAVELADVIRTTGTTDRYTTTVRQAISDLSDYWSRVRFLARVGPTTFRNTALLLVFAALAGVYALDVGSLATLGTTMLILIRSLTYVQGFQGALQDLHNNLPWLDDLWSTDERLTTSPVGGGGAPLAAFGAIDLDDVSYTYPNGTRALAGITTSLAPGEIIGVVGPSGAGKSSLAQLLLGLRQPTTGTIRIDGQALDQVDDESWTEHLAYVPQDPRLLPASAAANIGFLRDVDRDAVIRAAQAAGIHDDIVGLPDGYETVLESGDTRLSGGQRQRLALARALVTEPSLLVLDEPTSALDLRTEALVADAISALGASTTVVVIAHRLSSLNHCDRLLVIEGGRLTADGRPGELIDTNEFYREAVRLSELNR